MRLEPGCFNGGFFPWQQRSLSALLITNQTAPLIRDTRFNPNTIAKLGFVGPIVMMWLSAMDAALKLQKAGVLDAILRYEELDSHKVEAVVALVGALYPELRKSMEGQVSGRKWRDI